MNKTRQSLFGSISSVAFTLLNGLVNLIVIRSIIEIYGSDFNGLNSTATQFINMLLVVEGGFALAANVSLFGPLSAGDTNRINGILAAVSHRFNRIGIAFCGLGIIGAIIFAFVVKTGLPFGIRFWTFMMLVASTGFNLLYATKYKTLFQSDQKEYYLNTISIIFLVLSNGLLLGAICLHLPMLVLRLIIMTAAIGNSITIALLCKRKYTFVDLRVRPDYKSISGTGDVFAQKITGVLYFSIPILFISTFDGTKTASIYAVYNTIFMLIRSLGNAIINAPRMSLGRLIAEEGLVSKHLNRVFDEYETCLIFALVCMLITSTAAIMPFIRVYSAHIADAEYVNWGMAFLLTLTCFFESIHIPSGNLLNMAGKFRVGRNIQLIAGIVLLFSLIIGGALNGITGILIAVLSTAVLLAAMEIGYVRLRLLEGGWRRFIRIFFSNTICGLVLVCIELQIHIAISNMIGIIMYAGSLFILNILIMIVINLIVNRTITITLFLRFRDVGRLLLRSLKRDGEST